MTENQNAEKIYRFLAEHPVQFLATVGTDGKPKVRPFQMMFREDGRLFFCTGGQKEVYRELVASPYVELSCSTDAAWLRVRGRVVWIEDGAKKARAIASSALVRSIYGSADNPIFKLFTLAEAEATLTDFSGNPPLRAQLTE